MINIYKFHHCPSLIATRGFEPTTSRSQSGEANHSAIPLPTHSYHRTLLGSCHIQIPAPDSAVGRYFGFKYRICANSNTASYST